MIERRQAIEDLLWRSGLGPLSREQAAHFASAILALDDLQAEKLQGLVARHPFELEPITDEKLARRLVTEMLEFCFGEYDPATGTREQYDEDVAVNGINKQNRERLVRQIARTLKADRK